MSVSKLSYIIRSRAAIVLAIISAALVLGILVGTGTGGAPVAASISHAASSGISWHCRCASVLTDRSHVGKFLPHEAQRISIYTVRRGDTLSKIATKLYGRIADWTFIYFANRRKLNRDPNVILVGQSLRIPVPHGVPPRYSPPVVATPVTPAATSPATLPSYPAGSPPASFTQCVISRESGGDPTAYNTSSGASGLFGFLLSTWLSTGVGYPGGASTAPVSVQFRAFDIMYARDGVSPWRPYDGC